MIKLDKITREQFRMIQTVANTAKSCPEWGKCHVCAVTKYLQKNKDELDYLYGDRPKCYVIATDLIERLHPEDILEIMI